MMIRPKTDAEPSVWPGRGTAAVTAGTVIAWAVTAGVATGLLEALWLACRRHVMDRIIYQGVHYFWLSPLTNLIIFLVIGCVVAMGAKLVPWLQRPRLVVWIFLFVAMIGLRSLAPRVHAAAWLVLAAGVATSLSRPLTVESVSGLRRLRRVAAGAVVLVAVLMLVGGLQERREDRLAVANLPTPIAGAPNVLWIVLDTVPAKRMSLYGYHRSTTPRIDQFAKTGVVFTRCMSPSPWTLPSHASMFTGVMPQEQTSGWTEAFRNASPTIAEWLQQRGYATAAFVANTYYLPAEFGLSRGFGKYQAPRTWLMQAIKSSQLAQSIAYRTILPVFCNDVVGQKTAAEINSECLHWLNDRSDDRPYFAFVNYIDTHGPYVPPIEFAEKFGVPEDHPSNPHVSILDEPNAPAQLRALTTAYEACLSYVDHQIGELLSRLNADDRLDNTLVIITADHGEQLGENQVMGHSNSLYLPQIHVPLVISFPDHLPQGKRTDAIVSLADLPASVADLLGHSDSPFPGTSMVGLMTGAVIPQANRLVTAQVPSKPKELMDENDRRLPIARGELRAALTAQYHYIKRGDGAEELYRYTDDLNELRNRINDASAAAELKRLRAAVSY
jgi:arylsulfatase A-like enzyme